MRLFDSNNLQNLMIELTEIKQIVYIVFNLQFFFVTYIISKKVHYPQNCNNLPQV